MARGLLAAAAALLGYRLVAGALPMAMFWPLAWVLLVGFAVAASRPRVRQGFVAGSSVAFGLGLAEFVTLMVATRPASNPLRTVPSQWDRDVAYFRRDTVLGYALRANAVARAREFDDSGTIYDVTYHATPWGTRLTPASNDTGPTVAFFGESYTYGEGLEDSETLPNRFAEATGGRYRVLNLALHGYGPHHMLRAIETGRYDSLIGRRPAAFYFLSVNWQALRSAGRMAWDSLGPMYRLVAGTPRYMGHFHEHRRRPEWRDLSVLYRLLLSPDIPLSDADLELYVAIIRRADELLRARYGVGLTVIAVRDPAYEPVLRRVGWSDDRLFDALRATGVALVDGTLPDPPADDPYRYGFRRDRHPTAAANVARADILVRALVGPVVR